MVFFYYLCTNNNGEDAMETTILDSPVAGDELNEAIIINRRITESKCLLKEAPDDLIDKILVEEGIRCLAAVNSSAKAITEETFSIIVKEAKRRFLIN